VIEFFRIPISAGSILKVFLVGILLMIFSGCASTDPKNRSDRPWASPKSWESGLPGGMDDYSR
jgi:hypothetical protein